MPDADKLLNKKDQKNLEEKRGEGTGKDYVPFIVEIRKLREGLLGTIEDGVNSLSFVVRRWLYDDLIVLNRGYRDPKQ